MPLTHVVSVRVRPGCERRYEELVARLAEKARKKKEKFHWTAHQALFGGVGTSLHFVSESADFAGFARRGTVPELAQRVIGAREAEQLMEEAGHCIEEQRNSISIDRPDLSYPPPDPSPKSHPAAVVTTARVRPGRQEAFEELLRKLAEAIPKVDDPARMLAYQSVIGDLSQYWTVRPLRDLSELDKQRTPPDLLNQAFGAGEGGLLYRGGIEAIEQAQREIVMYREDLSNPA